MYNPFTLQDKKILVTGASSGIGRSIAIECSRMGAELIITGRDITRLEDTYKQLEGYNHKLFIADLSDQQSIEGLAISLPPIDGLVHSAGIAKLKPFQFLNRTDLEETLNTNFLGPALLSSIIFKKKLIRKGSSIVFISSISGIVCSSIGGSAYSSSKGAINGMVKGMALDLASKRIRVNSILPGMVDTKIFKDSSITQEQLEKDKIRYPLGRYGRPEDVAYCVIYLLSDASRWMTGSNIIIDGGFTLI
jgi:NAD(P)-dependent dehydrogenase (short-subunit alcohol dehydrogenase family)